MYLRRIRHQTGELSLSETLDTDPEGNSLSLMDVLCSDDDMTENLATKDACALLKYYANNYDSSFSTWRSFNIARYDAHSKFIRWQEATGFNSSY